MATEAELEQLENELRVLVIEAAKREDLSSIDDMQRFVERVLERSGYVLRNGVWIQGDN